MKSSSKEQKEYSDNTLETYYSKTDLAEFHLFQGNYINWGYWKDLDISYSKEIEVQTRIKSSEQLYKLVFSHLLVHQEDKVLEVGCGKGLGCAQLTTAYKPKLVVGIDLFKEQINRSTALHAELLKQNNILQFKVGSAEKIPFEDDFFTKLYSVEAAQHFQSISKFFNEGYRVLRRNGIICITTYFGKTEDAERKLSSIIPCIEEGADKAWFIDDVLALMNEVGFRDIQYEAIGEYVFEGWDIWMAQMGYDESFWGRLWIKAYKQGLIDYFVVTARK